MLGTIAAVTERVALGPLVARISVVPAVELVESFATLHEISAGRVIAALGLGDKASAPECVAYGLAVGPLSERAVAVASVCDALSARGVTTWVGGRSHTARALAGEHAHGWNLWDGDVSDFAEPGRSGLTLSWAGPCLVGATSARVTEKRRQRPQLPGPAGTVEELVAHARSYADAGVSWMIYAPPDLLSDPSVVDLLAKVASSLRP
jgi:hypothetical protein